MKTRIEIYKSENTARSAAKFDFANILDCKPESLRLKNYRGYGHPSSCKCECGETQCFEFYPSNLSRKQEAKLQEYKDNEGMNRNFWYGVCSSCGIKF